MTKSAAIHQELRDNLRVGLMTGGLGGLILGFLFAGATLALNHQLLESGRDVFVLVLGLQLVYSVFCLSLGVLGALGKTLLFAFTGKRISGTKTAAFITGTVFFSITAIYGFHWCRWHRIGGLAPEELPSSAELPVLITIVAVSVLLARLMTYAFYLLLVHFKKPEKRRPGDLRKAVFVLLYMAGAFALFVGALHISQSAEKKFSGLSIDDISKRIAPVRFVGIDGMDERDVARMHEKGFLQWATPCLNGATAPVKVGSRERAIAPLAWTLIATGQPIEAHGIVDYSAQVVRGLSRPFTVRPNQVGLFQLFQDVLPAFRLTRAVPMRSTMREAKGLWNMASDGGLETALVNWWVSWPAERIRGSVVSDRTYMRLVDEASQPDSATARRSDFETFPSSLLAELKPLVMEDDSAVPIPAVVEQDRVEQALSLFASLAIPSEVLESDLFYARSALYLQKTRPSDLALLHLPGPDVLRRVLTRKLAEPLERQVAFDRALEAYWTVLDPVLSQIFASSVGYRVLLTLPGSPLSPATGQNGTWSLAGPDVLPGKQSELALGSITPTLLWLLGLPHSEEMQDDPRPDMFTPSLSKEFPLRQIHSYGKLETQALEKAAAGEMDAEQIELLRSLGYIDE